MTEQTYRSEKANIQAAAEAYYRDGTSPLSDAEYDTLEQRVMAFEREHPELVDGVPLETVVSAGTGSGTFAHSVPMLSLDKVTDDRDAVQAWLNSRKLDHSQVCWEPKLDGSSVSIHYVAGRAVRMVTRGDGFVGEDRTDSLALLANLPTAPVSFTAEVRGEVLFTREQFAAANELRTTHSDAPFANARNGAAGALAGGSSRSYRIPLTFVAFDVVPVEGGTPLFDDHEHNIAALRASGFTVAPDTWTAPTLEDAFAILSDPQLRNTLPVEIDGVVIKARYRSDRDRLGIGSRTPAWALAFKVKPDLKSLPTSVLRAVEWAVGRTGAIAPRAVIDPTRVGGILNDSVTLHNPSDMERSGIMIGDTVYLMRAGDVIPRIEGIDRSARDGSQTPIEYPQVCPHCGSEIDRSQAVWRCVQREHCSMLARLTYAVSKDALDIDGLARAILVQLVDTETVRDLGSLFALDVATLAMTPMRTRDELGVTVATKIMAQIDRARTAELSRWITALGIPGTGRSMSKKLAQHCDSLEALAAATVDDLMQIESVGPSKAAEIVRFMGHPSIADLLTRLRGLGVHPSVTQAPSSGVLTGQKVCITGTMNGALAGKSRSEVGALVESLGATLSSSVSSATTLLLAGDKAGSKLAKATSLGVPVMTDDEFAQAYL